MTRLAVTGAGGYIGGAVVAAATGDPGLSVRSIVREPAPWLTGEVVQVADLGVDAEGALDDIEVVLHLAGPNEVETARDPVAAIASAIGAARSVTKAAAAASVRRIVYVSTVHVYGAALQPGAQVDEQTIPMPRHPYAIARLACEHIIAAEAGPLEVVVLRLTNAVGPPAASGVDRWSLVANDLCRQAVSHDHLELRTDGQDWRDFVALDDVSQIILAATDSDRLAAGTYNLGSGSHHTIRELAELVIAQAGRTGLGQLELRAPAGRTAPPEPFVVSVDKLASQGLSATVTLDHAVAETLEFCLATKD